MLSRYHLKKIFLPVALITAIQPILAMNTALLRTSKKFINPNLSKLYLRNFSILNSKLLHNNSSTVKNLLKTNNYNTQTLFKNSIRYYSQNNDQKLIQDLINSKEFNELINCKEFCYLINKIKHQPDFIELKKRLIEANDNPEKLVAILNSKKCQSVIDRIKIIIKIDNLERSQLYTQIYDFVDSNEFKEIIRNFPIDFTESTSYKLLEKIKVEHNESKDVPIFCFMFLFASISWLMIFVNLYNRR